MTIDVTRSFTQLREDRNRELIDQNTASIAGNTASIATNTTDIAGKASNESVDDLKAYSKYITVGGSKNRFYPIFWSWVANFDFSNSVLLNDLRRGVNAPDIENFSIHRETSWNFSSSGLSQEIQNYLPATDPYGTSSIGALFLNSDVMAKGDYYLRGQYVNYHSQSIRNTMAYFTSPFRFNPTGSGQLGGLSSSVSYIHYSFGGFFRGGGLSYLIKSNSLPISNYSFFYIPYTHGGSGSFNTRDDNDVSSLSIAGNSAYSANSSERANGFTISSFPEPSSDDSLAYITPDNVNNELYRGIFVGERVTPKT